MEQISAAWRKLLSPERFTVFVIMLVILAGLAGSLYAGVSSAHRSRAYLRGQAQTIANALPTNEITALDGAASDVASLPYSNLKNSLTQIQMDNNGLDYVYLLGKNVDGSHFYYVDSGSEITVAPGQMYSRSNDALGGLFLSSGPLVQGPSSDFRGNWVSAYAPVLDPISGKIVAVVGVDSSVSTYYADIALYALIPLLLAAIPLAGLFWEIKLRGKQRELLALKNQFVSISSHELRSPLTGMLWAIQSLSRSGASRLNLEQLSMLGAMYHSVESSLATVNEILDFSIFERGHAKIQLEPTDVSAVIKQVVATLSLSAREKRLVIEPVGTWPRRVYTKGDVAALKRAFMNMLSNSIKYSHDSGSIEITYQRSSNEHVIGIRDHGIGIPKNELDKVMDGYYRATNATKVEVHGTGLGVLVSKKIIERHGGRLWIESEEGTGTDLFIALPILAVDEPHVVSASTVPKGAATNPAQSVSEQKAPRDQGLSSTDIP